MSADQPATAATEYDRGYVEGYAAAIKDVQVEFTPLWQAVQQAVARSHALDSFIIERRKVDGENLRPTDEHGDPIPVRPSPTEKSL